MILMFSFCFVLPGLTQETKEAEGTYTIKKGDTLWDISSKFLKDPFLWPKLWERNPYITNPHLIFPGNPVRLSAIEPVKKEEPKKVAEEKPKEPVREAEVKAEVKKVASVPPPVEKKEESVGEKRPAKVEEKPLYFPEVRSGGFMSDIPYRGIGIVLEGREGRDLMCAGDIVYLAFRTSEPILIGNKYTVFRVSDEIRHPITEKLIGRKYNIIGNVQIIDRYGSFFTAKIIEAFDGVMRGDLIQPYSKEKMEGDFGK
jgi:hypothetical protein